MKCFHHPDLDAVGACQSCGRAACRDCAAAADGPLTCLSCLSEAVAAPRDEARTVLGRARVAAVLGGVAGAALGLVAATQSTNGEDPAWAALAMGAGLAYFTWCGYWGLRTFWRGMGRALGALGVLLWIPVTWPLFCFFLALATTYGILGGGPYQWLKHRSLAAGRSSGVAARNGILGVLGGFVVLSVGLVVIVPAAIRWSGHGSPERKAAAAEPPQTQRRARPPSGDPGGARRKDEPSARNVFDGTTGGGVAPGSPLAELLGPGSARTAQEGAVSHLQAVTLEPSLRDLVTPEYHPAGAAYLDGWQGTELAHSSIRVDFNCGDNPGGAVIELHPRADRSETPFRIQWQHVNTMTVRVGLDDEGGTELDDWKRHESDWKPAEHLGGLRWRIPDIYSPEDLSVEERRRFPPFTLQELAMELARVGDHAAVRHVLRLRRTDDPTLLVAPTLLRVRVALPGSASVTTRIEDGVVTKRKREVNRSVLTTFEFHFGGC